MGALSSCCRRRKQSGEREPLLAKHTKPLDAPSQVQLDKLVEILVAIKARKFPSQEQINAVLNALLRSDLLCTDDRAPLALNSDELSEVGKQVINSSRELASAILKFGKEKNYDNKLQDFLYECAQVPSEPIHADVVVEASDADAMDINDVVRELPSQKELEVDSKSLLKSLKILTTTIATSTAFRLLLSDLYVTARELVADAAADIGRVALKIEKAAEIAEEASRPVNSNIQIERQDTVVDIISEDTRQRWDRLESEAPDRVKGTIIARIQQLMLQANSNPSHARALSSVRFILRKYSSKVGKAAAALSASSTPAFTPIVWTEPQFSSVIADLGVLLSRLSGQSLEQVSQALYTVLNDVKDLPNGLNEYTSSDTHQELRAVTRSLDDWFTRALSDPSFVTSRAGTQELESSYDRLRTLVNTASQSRSPWLIHLRNLFSETDKFLSSISVDPSTRQLVSALTSIEYALSPLTTTVTSTISKTLRKKQHEIRSKLIHDAITWLFPRILRALGALPFPRFEYVSQTITPSSISPSPSLELAIDSTYLTPTSAQLSLVPDSIRVLSWTDMKLDMTEDQRDIKRDAIIPSIRTRGMKRSAKVQIKISGMRLSLRRVGFYVCYQLFAQYGWLTRLIGWLGYEDAGLVSIDMGARGERGEGLDFDISLELLRSLDSSDEDDRGRSLWKVEEIHVDIPGLDISFQESKHWLLNSILVRPLAGSVGRLAVRWVLESQIRSTLERLGQWGAIVMKTANDITSEEERETTLMDYLSVGWHLMSIVGSNGGNGEAHEAELVIDTHSHATTRGIVQTTIVQPPSPSHEGVPVTESSLAIGVGPQIVTHTAGPEDTNDQCYGTAEVGREALEDIQTQLDGAQAKVRDAVEVADEVKQAGNKVAQQVQRAELPSSSTTGGVRTGGWRSSAFDLL